MAEVLVVGQVDGEVDWSVIFLWTGFAGLMTDISSQFGLARERNKNFRRFESIRVSQIGHWSGILAGDIRTVQVPDGPAVSGRVLIGAGL